MKHTAIALALLIFLSACAPVDSDRLFRLPKPPTNFERLQQEIDALLAAGGEYAPPVSGVNRQAMQAVDIKGSGIAEILVFMRFQGEKTMRVYLYHLVGDDYAEFDIISENAENIHSIHYSDVDGDGIPEIIVGWQVGMLKTLSLYKFDGERYDELLSTNYTELALFDMLGRGHSDLLVIQHNASAFEGSAVLYYHDGAQMLSSPQMPLSKGVQGIVRVLGGMLADGAQALCVASLLDKNTIVTDVFTIRDGHFFNVSLNPESGISDETERYGRIFSEDLDGDGIIEFPRSSPLPGHEASSENTGFWSVNWRNYDTYGRVYYRMTTYHSPDDGWYIILPDEWKDHFTVTSRSVSSAIRSTTLAYYDTNHDETVDLCVIYCFTGDSRSSQAPLYNRLYLGEKSDAVFSAELFPDASDKYELTAETLTSMFRLIENLWITGETAA